MNRPAHRLALGLLCALTAGCEAQTGPAPISGDVPEAKGWRTEVMVGGLSHPWSIAWLPDGSALVTEGDGRLRRVRDGKLDPVPLPAWRRCSPRGRAACSMSHCIRTSPSTGWST